MTVLDLFAGIGGLSVGFAAEGFTVIGVDDDEASAETFALNQIGEHVLRDLRTSDEIRPVPVVVGGPPCRPWSAVNVQKRGRSHEDHALLHRFFHHILKIRPRVFLMENVPPLAGDPDYLDLRRELEFAGYSVGGRVLRYSDFGAATARRRLFTVGIRDSARSGWLDFFGLLEEERRSQKPGTSPTVRSAIGWLRDVEEQAVPDHDWSHLTTIQKYSDYYESGQFGWRILNWDETAPSFGSVAKTYILHPDSTPNAGDARVLSVREVLSIMGFGQEFRFPPGVGLTRRYRMAANAVSPRVSRLCARAIHRLLKGDVSENNIRRQISEDT